MQHQYARIRAAGADVLAVVYTQPEVLATFAPDEPLSFGVVADPTRAAFVSFGLGRTSWLSILSPASVFRYLKLIYRGWRPHAVNEGEDVLQLGGDFILDADGEIVYAYRSRTSTDRPAVAKLVDMLEAMKPE